MVLTSRLHFWNSPAVTISISRVYSNCCCSCSFEAEIIKIGQSSDKMYRNNVLVFQESTSILNAHKKKVWKIIVRTLCVYIYIYILHRSSGQKVNRIHSRLSQDFYSVVWMFKCLVPITYVFNRQGLSERDWLILTVCQPVLRYSMTRG